MLCASPHSAEASVKMARAVRKIRLVPNRSPSQPEAGMNTARMTRNPMDTPSTRLSGTESSREMVGSATSW